MDYFPRELVRVGKHQEKGVQKKIKEVVPVEIMTLRLRGGHYPSFHLQQACCAYVPS